jgi:hypothetical protein
MQNMKTFETKKAEELMDRLAVRNVALIKANKLVPEGSRFRGRYTLYIVKFSEMQLAIRQAGIVVPQNYMDLVNWLRPIARRVLPKYRKQLKKNLPS